VKRKPLSAGKLRRCRSLLWCAVCNLPIHRGQRYHDAGATRRAHVPCAKIADEDPAEEKHRHEQESASQWYWSKSSREPVTKSEPMTKSGSPEVPAAQIVDLFAALKRALEKIQ
jgi:hypothetical protein